MRKLIAAMAVGVALAGCGHGPQSFPMKQDVKGYKLAISINAQSASDEPFKDDHLKLAVIKDGVTLDAYYFVSSYGIAKANIWGDNSGGIYITLEYGIGRGTNARSEYLVVFKLTQMLNELIRMPLSGPAGPNSRWAYSYSISGLADNSLIVELSLSIDGEDAIDIPEIKKRTIRINAVE